MFKKTVLTLAFLTIFNTFYGFNDRSDASAAASAVLGATHSLLMEGDYVARQFGVPVEAVSDPATNIRVANKLLSHIAATLIFAEETSARDRISIILASYNGGLGHVIDARRLARAFGEDPDSWEVVARYLELKADPDYYRSEEVRCGRFLGSAQTLAYVDDVVDHYYKYCRIAAR